MWNVRIQSVNSSISKYFDNKNDVENYLKNIGYLEIVRIQILEFSYTDNKWYVRFDKSGE